MTDPDDIAPGVRRPMSPGPRAPLIASSAVAPARTAADVIRDYDPLQRSRPSALASAARGVAQGASLGFADEISAGVRSLFDPTRSYTDIRDELRDRDRLAREANPAAFMAGEIGGGLTSLLVPAGAAFRAGAAGAKGIGMLRAGAAGAAIGGLSGAGSSEGTTAAEIARDAIPGAIAGGVVGGGISAVGALARKGAMKFGEGAAVRSTRRSVDDVIGTARVTDAERKAIAAALEEIPSATKREHVIDLTRDAMRMAPGGAQTDALESLGGRSGVIKALAKHGIDDTDDVVAAAEKLAVRRAQMGARIGEGHAAIDQALPRGADIARVNAAFNKVRSSAAWRSDPQAEAVIDRLQRAQSDKLKRLSDDLGLTVAPFRGAASTKYHVPATELHRISRRLGEAGFESTQDDTVKARLGRDLYRAIRDEIKDHAAAGARAAKDKTLKASIEALESLNKDFGEVADLSTLFEAAARRAERAASPMTEVFQSLRPGAQFVRHIGKAGEGNLYSAVRSLALAPRLLGRAPRAIDDKAAALARILSGDMSETAIKRAISLGVPESTARAAATLQVPR